MYTKHDNLEKIDKLNDKGDSLWKQTPASAFGSKCIMSEHDICHDPKCACLCHQKEVEHGG